MEVRCEKCQTAYPFDEQRLRDEGASVKCAHCGHLFRIKRRTVADELGRKTAIGHPNASDFVASGTPTVPVDLMDPAAATGRHPILPDDIASDTQDEAARWQLRLTSGETFRFTDLATLHEWIVQGKVTRHDELSRRGERWQRLGEITEFTSFFQVVDQAQAAVYPIISAPPLETSKPAATPTSTPKRISTPRPMPAASVYPSERSGPTMLGALPRDSEILQTMPHERSSRRGGALFGVVVGAVLLLGAGYFALTERKSLEHFVSGRHAEAAQAYREGRENFLLDTDEGFLESIQLFERARGADPKDPLPIAALAEVNATWALDTTDAAARATHVASAKRNLAEATALGRDLPEVSRASAIVLLAADAPTADVELALKKAPADAEGRFVEGALRFRDKQLDAARKLLEQANELGVKQFQHGLVRAQYLLAKIDIEQQKPELARKELESILAVSPQHRARALLAALEARAAAVDLGAPPVVEAAAAPASPPKAAVAVDLGAPKSAEAAAAKPADVKDLLAEANRLMENGRGKQARQRYERALELDARSLPAMIGLGYCDLDGERYLSAIDRFNRVLQIAPNDGEALIGVAEAYKISGKTSEANEAYRRYLSLYPAGAKAGLARRNLPQASEPSPPPSAPAAPSAELPRLPKPPKADEAADKPPAEKADKEPPAKPAEEKPEKEAEEPPP